MNKQNPQTKSNKKHLHSLLKGLNDKIKDEYGVDEDIIDPKDVERITRMVLPEMERKTSSLGLSDTMVTQAKIEDLFLSLAKASAVNYYYLNTQGAIPLKTFYYGELKRSLDIEHLYPTFKPIMRNHKKNLFHIIDRLSKENKVNEINTYLRGIPKSYTGSLNQQLVRIFEVSQGININLKKIETKDLEKYRRFFDECSGTIEIYIKIIYGLEMSLKNPSKTFETFIRCKAYSVKKGLREIDPAYAGLLGPFNTNIWNSIKHKQFKKYPSVEEIEFEYIEGKKIEKLRITYNDFLKLSKENFSALTIISKYLVALELKLAGEL